MIDHQIQSFDENLTTHDPIDDESCLRKQPTWMIDYISRDDLSDDDQIVHFALFANYDPLVFQKAIKETK